MVQLGWRLHLTMALMMMMVDYAAPIHFGCFVELLFFSFSFLLFRHEKTRKAVKMCGAAFA